MSLDSQRARELGRRSGQRRRRLTLDDVARQVAPLDSIEHTMTRLDTVGRWALAGMLPGAIASAVVRSCEVWLKAHDAEATFEVLEALRADVAALKAERDHLAQEVERLELALAHARTA